MFLDHAYMHASDLIQFDSSVQFNSFAMKVDPTEIHAFISYLHVNIAPFWCRPLLTPPDPTHFCVKSHHQEFNDTEMMNGRE